MIIKKEFQDSNFQQITGELCLTIFVSLIVRGIHYFFARDNIWLSVKYGTFLYILILLNKIEKKAFSFRVVKNEFAVISLKNLSFKTM